MFHCCYLPTNMPTPAWWQWFYCHYTQIMNFVFCTPITTILYVQVRVNINTFRERALQCAINDPLFHWSLLISISPVNNRSKSVTVLSWWYEICDLVSQLHNDSSNSKWLFDLQFNTLWTEKIMPYNKTLWISTKSDD